MADETQTNVTPPTGTAPTPPATGDNQPNAGNQSQDNSQTQNQSQTQDNGLVIPKHRFDEVSNELKALKEWRKTQEENQRKAEEEGLKKKGEFEKLAQSKEQEANTWKEKYNSTLLNSDLRDQARALGAVDPAVVVQLIDRTGLEIGEDGTVKGAKEAVEKLLTEKPFLKGNGATPSIGSPTNPNGEPLQQRRFKASQLRDPKFFRENEKDIMTAVRLGLVENDLPH